jgi:hypothetical protein
MDNLSRRLAAVIVRSGGSVRQVLRKRRNAPLPAPNAETLSQSVPAVDNLEKGGIRRPDPPALGEDSARGQVGGQQGADCLDVAQPTHVAGSDRRQLTATSLVSFKAGSEHLQSGPLVGFERGLATQLERPHAVPPRGL